MYHAGTVAELSAIEPHIVKEVYEYFNKNGYLTFEFNENKTKIIFYSDRKSVV